jgi:hypothetical protein
VQLEGLGHLENPLTSSGIEWKTPIIADMFTVPLLRNGLHNTVVLLLLGTDDVENTASSIFA